MERHAAIEPHYYDLLKGYEETGLFIFAAEAFLHCLKRGYALPDELTAILKNHLQRFVNAKTDKIGKAALGFGQGSQITKAENYWNNVQRLSLLDDFKGFGVEPLYKRFEALATKDHTDVDSIKTWY